MVRLVLGEIGEVDVLRHFAPVALVEPQGPEDEGFVQSTRVDIFRRSDPALVFFRLMRGQRRQLCMQDIVQPAEGRIHAFDAFAVENID